MPKNTPLRRIDQKRIESQASLRLAAVGARAALLTTGANGADR